MKSSPRKYIRIITTDFCNLDCKYCFNEGIDTKNQNELTLEKAIELAIFFNKKGAKKLRLTGGEPLLWTHLFSFLEAIKNMSFNVIAITTNGTLLEYKAIELYHSGITNLSVSLPTLNKDKYRLITGYDFLEKVKRGIIYSSDIPYKNKVINCVYSSFSSLEDICELIEFSKFHNYNLRIIDVVIKSEFYQEIKYLIDKLNLKYIAKENPKANIERYYLEQDYYIELDFNPCNFLVSNNSHFCAACYRDYAIRITPSGLLKDCLLEKELIKNIK